MSDRLPLISSQRSSSYEGEISKFPDWRELVVIIMERAWIGGIVAFAVFLFFLVGLARETRYYRSTAMLLVEAQIPRLLNYQDVVAFNSRNLEYFNTIISTLHSQKIMEHALTTSGLATNEAFLPQSRGLVAKAAAARKLVQIVPVEKSRLINIMVEYPEPVMASDLANAVAESYIQADLDDRMKASMQAVDWLRERSEEYRQKLEAGLSQLQEYRESTESVSLEEDQNIVIAKLKAINTTLTEAQSERISAETQWQAVDDQLKSGVPMSQIAAQLNDAGVTEALRQLQEQQRLIAELQQRYKPGYPALKQALELETNLQESFNKACDNAVNVLKSRYQSTSLHSRHRR